MPVIVRFNGNDFMPGGNGREELIAFAMALAVARRGHRVTLCERGIPCTLVGDARRPGLVLDAVHQGFLAAQEVA